MITSSYFCKDSVYTLILQKIGNITRQNLVIVLAKLSRNYQGIEMSESSCCQNMSLFPFHTLKLKALLVEMLLAYLR